jgi:hypothetical protein
MVSSYAAAEDPPQSHDKSQDAKNQQKAEGHPCKFTQTMAHIAQQKEEAISHFHTGIRTHSWILLNENRLPVPDMKAKMKFVLVLVRPNW